MSQQVDDLAKILLDYMTLGMSIEKCDVIIGFGVLDIRVGKRAAELMRDGYGDILLLTGGKGHLTKHHNKRPEAEIFADEARKLGVPDDKILLETKAQNTKENILFSDRLLEREGIKPRSILLVCKNYMERRVYATFKKQWRDQHVKLVITSPQLSYEENFNQQISKELMLNVLVADVNGIKELAEKGVQIAQEIPDNVWAAKEALAALGYDEYLKRAKQTGKHAS